MTDRPPEQKQPLDEPTAAAWIDRYVRAWETNDSAAIGELFAEDARYYPGPDEEPWRDRAGIVTGWLGAKDEPGNWTFRYNVIATANDLAFVRGWTHYVEPPTDFSNLWVMRFDAAGRCVEFTEWWMEKQKTEE